MLPGLRQFHTVRKTHPGLGIGLMAGTSLDAVDAALVEIGDFDGQPLRLRHYIEMPIPPLLRRRLADAMLPAESSTPEICQLNFEVGELFAQAARQLCESAGIGVDQAGWIGSHGQTIYHIPQPDETRGWRAASTLQIGEPSVIAQRTGIAAVGDFRVRDMAAGGVGAPLIPFVDALLFQNTKQDIICQNIGGIANCTLLGRDGAILAFDSGPGNMVMDWLMRRNTPHTYDRDGETARRGRVNQALLNAALQHEYFAKAPPKATGHEDFGRGFVEWFETAQPGMALPGLMATALELTAQSIVRGYRQHLAVHPPCKVILSGGGAKNARLVERLCELAPELTWKTIDDYGIPSEAKEALGFAVLGYAALHRIPANVPSVTKANQAVVLGKVVY